MEKMKSKGFTIKLTLRKGSESGFDLKLDEAATAIKFELKLDDKADMDIILIGAKGAHPQAAEFALPAKPSVKK